MVDMEESNASPIDIDSDQGDRGYVTNMICLNNKRKFHPEEFDLPMAKNKCRKHKCDLSFGKSLEVEDSGSRISGITNEGESSDDLEYESVQDADGFVSYPDAAMCLYGSEDSEQSFARKHAYDQPSPSVLQWNINDMEKNFGGIGYRDDTTEQCEEKELLDIMYPGAVNANEYVLSSGRWNVNQDAESQSDIRKPTIDEEFEQFFSALMLK